MTVPYRYNVKGYWRKTKNGKEIWVEPHKRGPESAPHVIKDTTVCEIPKDEDQ